MSDIATGALLLVILIIAFVIAILKMIHIGNEIFMRCINSGNNQSGENNEQ